METSLSTNDPPDGIFSRLTSFFSAPLNRLRFCRGGFLCLPLLFLGLHQPPSLQPDARLDPGETLPASLPSMLYYNWPTRFSPGIEALVVEPSK